jgi:hypothetical protein
MPRDLSADMVTATTAKVVYPIALVSLAFPSATLRMWTGYGVLSWDGHTWVGAGDLGEMSEIEEAVEVAAKGVTLRITGIPSDLAAASLTENYQGRAAVIYLGALNSGGQLYADPYPVLSGRMDVIEKQDGGKTASLTLTIENRLIDLNRNRERRLTDEDQKRDYPSDRGFEFVNSLQSKQLLWGNSTVPTDAGAQQPPDDGDGNTSLA